MDITLKNLGPIQEANFTVGDLTVICGRNNTGKTYITYALYGFLDDWEHKDYWTLNDADGLDIDFIENLLHAKEIVTSKQDFFNSAYKLLDSALVHFNRKIAGIFNGERSRFQNSCLEIKLDSSFYVSKTKKWHLRFAEDEVTKDGISIGFYYDNEKSLVNISVSKDVSIPDEDFIALVNDGVKCEIFQGIIPKAFIASAERTGAALFQREVDFTRSRLIDILKETNINPQQLLGRFTAEYPLPVKHNIDFIRDLPNIINKQSEFSQQHPEVLQAFADIAGGEYAINTAGGISYSPNNQPDLKLSLAESSSTVRSLVDIGFYLRHLAKKGDLLMVDEPELNLHPENQRKIARLFAMLVNHGIRVFITTHSDYIIKEFNTLLLLNKPDERLQALAQREGYKSSELLKSEQLNVYMTAVDERVTDKISYTLIPAKITHDSGIELTSFNDTIEDMNRLQDEIVWG